jgi:hypothetical protein
MSTIEDEIRDTLRSEAARLREVRPLDLPAALAPREPPAGPGALLAWRWRAWLVPAAAAAADVAMIQGNGRRPRQDATADRESES